MAIILAAATGNYSATGTWVGGVVPVAGDIVVANNRTITMDTLNATVAELRNDTTGGATAGGTFNLVNGSNVTANVYGGSTGSCVTWASTAGQTATITGQFFGGAGGSGVSFSGAGTLTCGGGSQLTGGSSGAAYGLAHTGSGTLNFATAASPGIIRGGTSTNQGTGLFCSGSNCTEVLYVSSIIGGSSTQSWGANFSGNNQNITIFAGSIGGGNSPAILLQGTNSSHTYNISGNIQAVSRHGIQTTGGSGTYNIIVGGSIIGSTVTSLHGITVEAGTGTYNITVGGDIIGGAGPGTASHGISASSTSSGSTFNVTVAGNIIGGAGDGCVGIVNAVALVTFNITANVVNTAIPSVSNNNYSISNGTQGTINLAGTATAGSRQVTCFNSGGGGIFRVTRATGNGFGIGSVGILNVVAVQSAGQNSATYVEEIQFGSLGATPVSGPIRFTNVTSNKCIVTTTTGSPKTLVDTAATSGILPPVADVRTGVIYSSGNLTGTCAVPPAGSVALGVAVDNTTGTAVLTEANVRSAVGLASANLDAQFAAIPAAPSAAAIRAEMDANSTKLANLDAAVSSRLASASYSAPLDAAGTRSAVGLASNNLDSQLSGISSGISGLPNATTVASQVRTELSTELARLDAAISTRLATSGYTTPPTAAAIATAVNSALDRTGFSLTSAERSAIATAVEQSILNESDGQAILNAIVGAIGNQNIDQVALVAAIRTDLERTGGTLATRLAAASYTAPPSAAANASAVRSEIGTELGRIDAAISSRLAPSGTLARVTLVDTTTTLTNAPDVPTESEIADAVRTELTPELSRISNAATTQEVGDIIEGAMQLPE